MVRRLSLFFLIFFSATTLADVNTDVADCLSASATTAGTKTSCVQSAINKEQNNQITTMFQTYSNFVNQEINSNTFGAAGGTPPPAPRATITTPSVQPVQPTAPPPPVAQPPKQSPQDQQGGIQYY